MTLLILYVYMLLIYKNCNWLLINDYYGYIND